MRRRFLRACINWWSDTQQPQWLRHAIKRDRDLQRYEAELASLSDCLREDAASWSERTVSTTQHDEVGEQSIDVASASLARAGKARHTIRAIQGVAAAAVVAAIVFSVVAWQTPGGDDHSSHDNVVVAANHADPPGKWSVEIQSLIGVYRGSVQGVEASVARLPTILGAVNVETSELSLIGEAARRPIKGACRRYGQALALIDRSVRNEIAQNRPPLRQILRFPFGDRSSSDDG